MECLELNKVSFLPNCIILIQKTSNITINIEDIDFLAYTKLSIWNCFYEGIFGGMVNFPGYLRIYLNKKIEKMNKFYYVKMSYNDILRLPEQYLFKILPRIE